MAIRLARLLRPIVLVSVCSLAACSSSPSPEVESDEYGYEGLFDEDGPLGKADSASVQGPLVNTDTKATQVWTARNDWEDTTTPAAKKSGIAWGSNSGLNWEQKYRAWIDSMEVYESSDLYYHSFTLTTPWGKELPAPKLECAELAMFLRITFASWYELPFFLTANDANGTRLFFGHFGARTATTKYKKTPNYALGYKDHSQSSVDLNEWPQDKSLRAKGLYGGGDDMPFLFDGARAGAYFDEIFLNKRVGHFLLLTLASFGSMHLASARNTFNLKPDAVQPGDVLLERWQKSGIGHTLVVKERADIENGQIAAELVSGSMPRRQPKWEDPIASKSYFTSDMTGGVGMAGDGNEYAALGGGLKRWRVTKNIKGYWNNTWMKGDEASWISDTDHETLSQRPGQFETLLGDVEPAELEKALVAQIEDNRQHLRQYPASCSARIRREEAFEKLYDLSERVLGRSREQTDREYRILDDYVLAELVYEESKTCCWNSTTSAMYELIMDYNRKLQESQCIEPVVFKWSSGYDVFKQYAIDQDREAEWRDWQADETCAQEGTVLDVEAEHSWVDYCEL